MTEILHILIYYRAKSTIDFFRFSYFAHLAFSSVTIFRWSKFGFSFKYLVSATFRVFRGDLYLSLKKVFKGMILNLFVKKLPYTSPAWMKVLNEMKG